MKSSAKAEWPYVSQWWRSKDSTWQPSTRHRTAAAAIQATVGADRSEGSATMGRRHRPPRRVVHARTGALIYDHQAATTGEPSPDWRKEPLP